MTTREGMLRAAANACKDIFTDFAAEEIQKEPTSVLRAWEIGGELSAEAERLPAEMDAVRMDWLQSQLSKGWGDGFAMYPLDSGALYPRPWKKELEFNFPPDLKTGAWLWQSDIRTAIDEAMRRALKNADPQEKTNPITWQDVPAAPAGSAPERKEAATDKAIVDAIASKPLDAWTPSDKLALLAFATRSTAPERREVARRLREMSPYAKDRYGFVPEPEDQNIVRMMEDAAALLDPQEGR